MDKFVDSIPNIVISAAVIIISYFIIRTVKKLLFNYLPLLDLQETKTKGVYLYNFVKYLVVIFATLSVLQINGVNVSSALTGLGVATVVVGFALQEYLKDVIMGLYIISEKFFTIGDAVKFGEEEGIVTNFTLKTTTIETISCRHTIKICNRDIDKITKLSDQVNINIPLSYDVPTADARRIMTEMCEDIKRIDGIHDAVFKGTQDFGDSAIIYRIKIFCDTKNKNQLRRLSLNAIQDKLDENSLKCPYNQIDVHQIS